MRTRSRWLYVAAAVVIAGVVLWVGGDWLWHLFLRMHGMEGGHR